MQDLINKLHEFANQDFPASEVSAYLESYDFQDNDR